jgi:hypothetical protein
MKSNLIIALNAIEQKHDLELALIDDLKKLNAVSLKESKSLTTAIDKAKLAISDAKAFNRNYAIALNNSIKVVDQAKVKAKELVMLLKLKQIQEQLYQILKRYKKIYFQLKS